MYRVIVATDLDDLHTKVNNFLKLGWKLQGGVSVAINQKNIVYAQAIVKN